MDADGLFAAREMIIILLKTVKYAPLENAGF